jgi:hypothetical protein
MIDGTSLEILQHSLKPDLPKHLNVPSSLLTLGKIIGQGLYRNHFINVVHYFAGPCSCIGEFGMVYKATLRKRFDDTISSTVAVKTLVGRHIV